MRAGHVFLLAFLIPIACPVMAGNPIPLLGVAAVHSWPWLLAPGCPPLWWEARHLIINDIPNRQSPPNHGNPWQWAGRLARTLEVLIRGFFRGQLNG